MSKNNETETTQRPIVWFDMDGVLCDWMQGMENLYDKPYADLSSREIERYWRHDAVSSRMFTALPPMPAGINLLLNLERDDVFDLRLLTSTGGHNVHYEIARDKAQWCVDVKLFATIRQLPLCCVPHWGDKMTFATPGAVLIDDYEATILLWNHWGGHGMLYTDDKAPTFYELIHQHFFGNRKHQRNVFQYGVYEHDTAN